ncbi:MAG: DUF6049 family protein [Acidimicrobiales bacterium]
MLLLGAAVLLPAALGAVPSLAAGGPAPAAATSATTGSTAFGLAGQSTDVTPGPSGTGTFGLTLSVGTGVTAGAEVDVGLYRALTTRSAFEATLSSPPIGEIDHAGPVPLSGLPPAADGGRTLDVTIVPGSTPSTVTGPSLSLGCQLGNGTCPGIYPVVVTLVRAGGGALARFTTYLTFTEGAAAAPLRFAWVVPVSSPVRFHGDRPGRALVPPSGPTVDALAGLVKSLESHPDVATTVAASPATVQQLTGSPDKAAQGVVGGLATLSASAQLHQFLPQPYVPIDLGAIAGAGERTEIAAQMAEGAAILRAAHVATSAPPTTWVASGTVGPSIGPGLADVGAERLVLPDSQLAAPSNAVSSGAGYHTWTYPFTLGLGHGRQVTAAAADGHLTAEFVDDPADPALEAVQVLADLAVIHFEAPNLTDANGQPAARGVVGVPPSGWTPSAAFDDQLLSGLLNNPVVTPVTLDGLFSQVALGGPSGVTSRRLASGSGTSLPRSLARQLTRARLRLTSFVSAVRPRSVAVLSQLDDLLLASEADTLRRPAQYSGVATFERALSGQLSLIKVATERTITLTARTAAIPITILSSAGYTVVGRLSVSSDRFLFPGRGGAGISRVVIDHPTTPERVTAEARTSGDLPLSVSLLAPEGDPPLVIAHGELTVRSTATSIVGIVLTVVAALVLLSWWGRTWRAGRRARRSRPAA